MCDILRASTIGDPKPGRRIYANLLELEKGRALSALFERARVVLSDNEPPKLRKARLTQDEISQCIIADAILSNEVLGSSFTTFHLDLIFEIIPTLITDRQLSKLSDRQKARHKEECVTYLAVEATYLERRGVSADDDNEILDLWVEHFPIRALIFYWQRMSLIQLLRCYSYCYINLPQLAKLPHCSALLSALGSLATSTFGELEKEILKDRKHPKRAPLSSCE